MYNFLFLSIKEDWYGPVEEANDAMHADQPLQGLSLRVCAIVRFSFEIDDLPSDYKYFV
jgi:hypothetical protein